MYQYGNNNNFLLEFKFICIFLFLFQKNFLSVCFNRILSYLFFSHTNKYILLEFKLICNFKFYFSEFQHNYHNCICYHFFLILTIYKWLHWALFIVLVTDFLDKKLYDQRDVDNVKNNDLFVRQFIRKTESLAETADRLHESLKWRKECGIRGGKLCIVFKDFKLSEPASQIWQFKSNWNKTQSKYCITVFVKYWWTCTNVLQFFPPLSFSWIFSSNSSSKEHVILWSKASSVYRYVRRVQYNVL